MTDIFKDLNFNKFKELALNEKISDSERVGFPDSYRKSKEQSILNDISSKLSNIKDKYKKILDIGPGASKLSDLLLDYCQEQNHSVTFIDSEEMLDRNKDRNFLTKIEACFPQNFENIQSHGPFDAILVYSVLQYPFIEGNFIDFIDKACLLLNDGGQLLLGDIPNISCRKRFFSSKNGINFHRDFTNEANSVPEVTFNNLELGQIDDSVILTILMRMRMSGYHAYVLPQASDLPMENRREDILIIKP